MRDPTHENSPQNHLKQNSHQSPEQKLKIQTRNKKQHEVVSFIEGAEQSFTSRDEILQQFKQFGLETIIISDDSFEKNYQKECNRYFFYDSTHKSQFSNQQNFNHQNSNINFQQVNVKQINNLHERFPKKNSESLKKFKSLKKYLLDTKILFQNNFNEASRKLIKLKQDNQKNFSQLLVYLSLKFSEQKKCSEKQKQQLKLEINSLKIIIDSINKQYNYLQSKIEQSNKQERQLKEKFQINNLYILSENVKMNQEMSKQYQKHTQTLRQLNKQILRLNHQVQSLTEENKKLKKLINEYDKKLKDQSNQTHNLEQKNVQSYNKFLQKIQSLQKQIYQLRKNQQIINKPQLSTQFNNQIGQFLQVYEKKEKQIILRQKIVQKKQKQLHRRLSLQQNDFQKTYQNDEQTRSKPTVQGWDLQSPLSKKNSSYFGCVGGGHDAYCSEKLIKLSRSQMSRSSLHNKHPFFISQNELDKSNPKRSSKYSNHLNTRIMRIQSSIANELNALGCGK